MPILRLNKHFLRGRFRLQPKLSNYEPLSVGRQREGDGRRGRILKTDHRFEGCRGVGSVNRRQNMFRLQFEPRARYGVIFSSDSAKKVQTWTHGCC